MILILIIYVYVVVDKMIVVYNECTVPVYDPFTVDISKAGRDLSGKVTCRIFV